MIGLKALLVLHGDIMNLSLLQKVSKEVDMVVCGDGGADYCFKASIMPDMIIGDLDSISHDSLKIIYDKNIPVERYPAKKDATDSELAIEFLINKNFKEIILMGAMGSRMDHTLSNIFLLKKLKDNGIDGKIIDEHNIIYLVDKELELSKDDAYISILSITNSGTSVTLRGFEYELDKINIAFGSSYGISNRIAKDKAYIFVHRGTCLVFISRD